jgi:hypothetical protein
MKPDDRGNGIGGTEGGAADLAHSDSVEPCAMTPLAAPLEELHSALVLLGAGARGERAEILAPLGGWVELARIKPVLTVRKFSDHDVSKPN